MSFNNNQYPDLFIKLLEKRGLTTNKDIEKFLYPKLADLPHPENMKNLQHAAEVVSDFVSADLQIIIWGDYDVDGTTGTALLINFFKHFQIDVIYHIPNRLTEGYGLNTSWFRENISEFKSKKFLLITVDCGISNCYEIDEIKNLGGTVIVSDHHMVPQKTPSCIIINPEQPGCLFASHKLAGVGVAFYLAVAMRNSFRNLTTLKQLANDLNMKCFLAFVALGTLADLVDLTPVNRILIKAGLESLKDTPFVGLKKFIKSCELDLAKISSEDVGFILGPRLNAAGRLGKSFEVVSLLLEENDKLIKDKISTLNILNNKRKNICQSDFVRAREQIQNIQSKLGDLCLVTGNFHPGVAGIVASKLVEEYSVPSLVLCSDESEGHIDENSIIYKGSGRSIEGVNLVEALNECSMYLQKYGGHSMAVGLAIEKSNIHLFEEALRKAINQQFDRKKNKKPEICDLEASVDLVMDDKMLYALELMEPYGPSNPQPVFRDKNIKLIQCRTVGQSDAHLSVTVRGTFNNYRGIAFNLGNRISEVQENPHKSATFTPTKNRFRGQVSWQVRITGF